MDFRSVHRKWMHRVGTRPCIAQSTRSMALILPMQRLLSHKKMLRIIIFSNATFLRSDLFAQIPHEFTFDLIVGNPPYIPAKDWATLDKSVSQWEDKNALIAAG